MTVFHYFQTYNQLPKWVPQVTKHPVRTYLWIHISMDAQVDGYVLKNRGQPRSRFDQHERANRKRQMIFVQHTRGTRQGVQYKRLSVRDERWISVCPSWWRESSAVRFLCGKHVVLAKVMMAHRAIDLQLHQVGAGRGGGGVHTWQLSSFAERILLSFR